MFRFCLYTVAAFLLSIQGLYSEQPLPTDHMAMLEKHSYQVLGLGSACMDLLIPVSEDFLHQHVAGEKGGAQKIEKEDLDRIVQASQIQPNIRTGGSCANAIKGLAHLGQACALIGKVGQDPLGEQFINYAKRSGIIPLLFHGKQPTPCVLCLITPDGQRTMRFFEGCSQEMSPDLVHPRYFEGVSLVHIEGYALRNGNLVKKTMEQAREAGALISFDLSSFEIVDEYRQTIRELLQEYVDIVFANEDETFMLTGHSPLEGCFELNKRCPISVVLIGKDGCLVGHQGEVFHTPGFHAKLIDTTGAGDLFASGFLYGYLKGYSLQTCAQIGNFLGKSIVETTGAELSEEKWKEVKQILSELIDRDQF